MANRGTSIIRKDRGSYMVEKKAVKKPLEVIDANGKKFEVVNAKKIRADYWKKYDEAKRKENLKLALKPEPADADIPALINAVDKREITKKLSVNKKK
jgi:hypothetical protein